MAKPQSHETANIRFSDRFSEAFNQFQEQIRERAYHLFLVRDPDQGDPIADWLEAQAQLTAPVQLEVKEQRKNTVVEIKLKDFTADEIEIEVAGNVLQIFGSHRDITESKEGNGSNDTMNVQTFFQSVPLHAPVDLGHSHAKLLRNGKLKVVLPKK